MNTEEKVRIDRFIALLRQEQLCPQSVRSFLTLLPALPADTPILKELGAMAARPGENSAAGSAKNGDRAENGGAKNGGAENSGGTGVKTRAEGGGCDGGIIARRMESRYERVRAVQESLQKLRLKERDGVSLDDMVFEQTDFSVYKSIPADTFSLLFEEGLDDFSDDFFPRSGLPEREELKKLIRQSYEKKGDGFHLKNARPLILPLIRTLHTSLNFRDLVGGDELLRELQTLFRFFISEGGMDRTIHFYLAKSFKPIYCAALSILDGKDFYHRDGMRTNLFIPPGHPLFSVHGTFRPFNKACTLPLIFTDIALSPNSAEI